VNDLTLFFITIALIVVTFGAAFVFARVGVGLHGRVRDVGGTALILGLLIEGTLVVILGEHFLEQFKSH